MTLKEIYKIINEADLLLFKNGSQKYIFLFGTLDSKESVKYGIESSIKMGSSYVFYKFDKETDKITILARVDHIDKEKKIIKKKLDEMTEEELKKLSETVCRDFNCKCCPLAFYDEYGSRLCLSEYFNSWKKQYLETKDREIEIEVEE